MTPVKKADADEVRREADALGEVLIDAVEDGGGLGFLPGLTPADAKAYFLGVADEVARGSRVVLVATLDGRIEGSAQLDLCRRPNGLHRAEVQKVMVHRRARRRGLGRALMDAIDAAAREHARTTLYLDTFAHQPAKHLYVASGWMHAGDIPEFSATAEGTLGATSLYYKLLR